MKETGVVSTEQPSVILKPKDWKQKLFKSLGAKNMKSKNNLVKQHVVLLNMLNIYFAVTEMK
jgi:hypothetical protein